MSLTQALTTTVAGLRTAQAGLALVAANVANAQTPGYVRKSLVQETASAGQSSIGVRVAAVSRELDQYVQRQLRVETSGAAYADLRAQFFQRLQQIYGTPGAASSLEATFNNFTGAVQALTTSPDNASTRSALLTSAQVLTQQLNGMTADIQTLRSDAERGLADAVTVANEAMREIAAINGELAANFNRDGAAASLADRRDVYIDRLAELMDIKVVYGERGEANIFTNSGVQLVGIQPAQLSFNAQGTVNASAQWDPDPAKSTVGSLVLLSKNGGAVDLTSRDAIRAGAIAAYLDMRDGVLVEAQAQLDALAGAMASALSDKTVAGSAVTVALQSGFELDAAGLLAGNTMSLTYSEVPGGQQHRVTIVRVDDPSLLPLKNTFSADPADKVIGVDFSGGMAAVAAQLNGHFNGKVTFSNPAAGVLRVLDDGTANSTNIDAFSARQTVTALAGGGPELPFFVDGPGAYTGAITRSGLQSVGYAGRITVNAALLADSSKLVALGPGTSAGDSTRPDFIFQRLTGTSVSFSPSTGIGSTSTPFEGTLPGFLRQALSMQGGAAEAAFNLAEGQQVVINALKQRAAEQSGVNVDQEMANLLMLQNAYGANARVMSVAREMLEMLMNV